MSKNNQVSYVVFEDLDKVTGPKVHSADCVLYQKWLKKATTTTTWHGPYESKEEAWAICKSLAMGTKFEPSMHVCLE